MLRGRWHYATIHQHAHNVDQDMLVCPMPCLSINSEEGSYSVLGGNNTDSAITTSALLQIGVLTKLKASLTIE